MGLHLVNTDPGESTGKSWPGKTVHLGLKSDSGTVEAGTINVLMGLSNICHHGLVPVSDIGLSVVGASVEEETTEHRRPMTVSSLTKVSSSGSLVITRAGSSTGETCINEVRIATTQNPSVMGYVKFKVNTSWGTFSPDWLTESSVVCPYFGLEVGGRNNACFAFLKATGSGSLVVGGVLPRLNHDRSAQQVVPEFDWKNPSSDGIMEIWIYYNQSGYPEGGSEPPTGGTDPNDVPVVEVWTRRGGIDEGPVLNRRIPVRELGEFPGPESGAPNYRYGPSDTAVLYFGNAGVQGDSLEILDWALFPDFRVSVIEGEARSGNSLSILPDGPVVYDAETGKVMSEFTPGRWFPVRDAGFSDPGESLYFQSWRVSKPLYTTITKPGSPAALEKYEPRIGSREDGFVVEALLSVSELNRIFSDINGAGFSVEDGERMFRVIAINRSGTRYFGISKNESTESLDGYHQEMAEVDWNGLRMVRMSVDRHRKWLDLYVEGVHYAHLPLDTTEFPAATESRVRVGHLVDTGAEGYLNVASLLYLPRYKAWESKDAQLPEAGPLEFEKVGYGSTFAGPDKMSVKNDPGSPLFYSMQDDFADTQGLMVDFSARVTEVLGTGGQPFPGTCDTGVGFSARFGNKELRVGFFSCGIHGMKIGIVPGSGSVDDIINQTALGRKFSTSVDWTTLDDAGVVPVYRVSYRAYEGIKVWVGSTAVPPALVIPWRNNTDGVDLPAVLSGTGISFGNIEGSNACSSEWAFFRWGQSNGYEVAVSQQYSSDPSPYLFGGKVLVFQEFGE